MSCNDCGASVDRYEEEIHVCEPERRLDYQMFRVRDEVNQFEEQLGEYLNSPQGRFEIWYAQSKRL